MSILRLDMLLSLLCSFCNVHSFMRTHGYNDLEVQISMPHTIHNIVKREHDYASFNVQMYI